MSYVEWTEDMGEISGFGGGYEEACRAMVRAGVEFWEAQDAAFERGERATKFDPKFHGYEGIFGVIGGDNKDAKALTKAVLAPAEEGGGATGAMHQAAISHVFSFRRLGPDGYIAAMREREKKEVARAGCKP